MSVKTEPLPYFAWYDGNPDSAPKIEPSEDVKPCSVTEHSASLDPSTAHFEVCGDVASERGKELISFDELKRQLWNGPNGAYVTEPLPARIVRKSTGGSRPIRRRPLSVASKIMKKSLQSRGGGRSRRGLSRISSRRRWNVVENVRAAPRESESGQRYPPPRPRFSETLAAYKIPHLPRPPTPDENTRPNGNDDPLLPLPDSLENWQPWDDDCADVRSRAHRGGIYSSGSNGRKRFCGGKLRLDVGGCIPDSRPDPECSILLFDDDDEPSDVTDSAGAEPASSQIEVIDLCCSDEEPMDDARSKHFDCEAIQLLSGDDDSEASGDVSVMEPAEERQAQKRVGSSHPSSSTPVREPSLYEVFRGLRDRPKE